MNGGPVIVAGDDTFRIVRVGKGDGTKYVVELPDGCDSLGVERWRDVSADGKVVKAMRDFIIRTALQGERDAQNV